MRGRKKQTGGKRKGYKTLLFKPLATGCDVSSPAFPPKARMRKYATAGLLARFILAPSQGGNLSGLSQNLFRSLQQRGLLRIFTGFPFQIRGEPQITVAAQR